MFTDTVENRVTVVDSAYDERLDEYDSAQSTESQRLMHRPKLAELVEAASGDDFDMLLHRQVRVERDTKVAYAVEQRDVDAPDRQTYTANILQLLWRAQPGELGFYGVEFETIRCSPLVHRSQTAKVGR